MSISFFLSLLIFSSVRPPNSTAAARLRWRGVEVGVREPSLRQWPCRVTRVSEPEDRRGPHETTAPTLPNIICRVHECAPRVYILYDCNAVSSRLTDTTATAFRII